MMRRKERGSSILEVLIALAILTLGISAAAMLSFANQTLKVDSDTSGEALYKAKDALEGVRATSTVDFNAVNSTATTTDGIYAKKIDVSDLTPCRKEITSRITWATEPSRPQRTELTTDLTDIAEALRLGGDCAAEPPSGGWTFPNTLWSRDLNLKPGDNPAVNSSAGNQATDIDVLNKMVYMTAGVSVPIAKDDFFVLDASNVQTAVPPIKGSLDIGAGLNALDVVRNPVTGRVYAYTVADANEGQLQIIDVTDPVNPQFAASSTLPNITFTCSPASAPCLAGVAITYYDNKIYIGTAYIANLALPAAKNNEFHVYCVSPDARYPICASASSTNPIWLGSANINHNVNSISIHGNYAYLATSDDAGELTVIDLSNLIAPGIKFDTPGTEDGKSVYLMGSKLYLGRNKTPAARKDFYILDVSHPPAVTELGSINLSLNSGAGVSDIRISGTYAFLAITDPNQGFEVLNIKNENGITIQGQYNYSENATGIEYENGYIYTSNAKNDALRIIRPAECADKIDDDSDGKIDNADPQCHTDGNANNAASYNPEDDAE